MKSCRLWFGNIGLGPNFLGPLRYLLPYNKRFHIAARFHDIAYSRGGDSSKKEQADRMFLRLMISVCETSFQSWWASLYFNLVWKFGIYFFKY